MTEPLTGYSIKENNTATYFNRASKTYGHWFDITIKQASLIM